MNALSEHGIRLGEKSSAGSQIGLDILPPGAYYVSVTRGDQVKRLRLAAGLTQKELAMLLEKVSATVSRWERNAKPVPLSSWMAVEVVCQERVKDRAKRQAK